jgi:predicted type IV restriction endonuclease
MTEQIVNFIEALKKRPNISRFDETETKQGMILPVLQFLGWNVWDIQEVKPEYPVEGKKAAEGGKVDYCLRIKGKSEVFLEAKRPGEDLEKHQEQLLDYSFREGVDLAILSNGILWWFYLPRKKGHWKDRKFYAIDVMQQATDEIAEKFTQLLSRKYVQSGEALRNAKIIDEQQNRQKKIEETLPKAWNKIIIEGDSRLLDLLMDITESMCGFRPENKDVKDMISYYKGSLVLPKIPIQPERREAYAKKPIHHVSETQKLRIKFFEELIEKTNTKTNLFSNISSPIDWVGASRSGVVFLYYVLKDASRIGIDSKNKKIFDALYKQRDEIEKEIGFTLEWHRNDNKVWSQIIKRFDLGGLNHPNAWPEIQEKMADTMVKIEKAIRPRLESIV